MKLTAGELRALYWDQRLSTRAVAERCGVSHMSVKRWLYEYGIERRPIGRGLGNRGIAAPTRDDLQRLVHAEYRSYKDIAALYRVDPAAVPYWLDKHGVAHSTIWRTRRKGDQPILPTSGELRAAYEGGLSMQAIASRCGVSTTTISRLFIQHDITPRTSGWAGGIRWVCKDEHRVRSSYEQRVDNWLSEHGIAHVYEPVLPFDRRCRADFLANGWYIEVWGVIGGRVYMQRKERKQRLYREHGLPLIEIPVHAFDTAHRDLWERKLAACLHVP